MTEKLNIKQLKPISTDVNLGTSDALLPTQNAVKTYVDTADSGLQTQIDALSGRGRFLSLWNCATGLAESNPPESPYPYKAGDYFVVGTVSSADPAVNYKPDGSSYTTGVASTTVETNEVSVNDTYFYDGSVWKLQSNAQKEVSFSALAGSPYDNTNLSNALNAKQDTLTAGNNITIDANNVISSTAQESFFRGNFSTWENVPTDVNDYKENYKHEKTPTFGDFMVVADASDYVNPDFSDDPENVAFQRNPNAFTINIIVGNNTISVYYTEIQNNYKTIRELFTSKGYTGIGCEWLKLKYTPGSPGQWYITSTSNYYENNELVSANTDHLLMTTNEPVISMFYLSRNAGVAPIALFGSWRFSYYGVWGTDGKNGWKPEYQVEDVLPVATDNVAGIMKLYTGLGTHIDGTITQNGIKTQLDTKQDTLTAGTNITIDANNVISSTAQESFFRGNFNEWTDVPTDTSLYQEDIHGNRVPKDTDFIIVEDASQFVPSGSLMHKLVVENLNSTEAFTIRITDENGVSKKYFYMPYQSGFVAIDDYYSLRYQPGNPGRWYIKTNDGSPIVVKGTTYQSGEAQLCITSDPATPFDAGMPPSAGEYTGAWRFAYYGVWSTAGITGWIPQYKIENTLPIADATTLGIAKLYTTTGNNTDGSMTQSSITSALNNKVDKNAAITGATHTKITYDNKGLVTAGADITLSDVTDITATAAEVNVLDGITATTTELNYVDGVTSSIQTQLTNNANNISNEIIDRQNADNGLQSQIDAIVAKSDVVDIVGTYAELQAYDTSGLGNNDVVKVISDSTHNNAPSYYRWVITGGVGAWVYIGSESETYTKAETDALLNAKQDTLTAGTGIDITSATISNSGVRSVSSGTTNGTISVNTNGTSTDVSVTGLGSAAYTSSSDYATSAQGGKADTAVQPGDLATVATTGDYDDLLNKPTIMTGASAGDAGTSGLVPAPAAGDQAKFLQGDGTWANPTAATAWGNITGTLSDQTDLQNALNAKADDNAVVHLSDSETITGDKTFKSGSVYFQSSGSTAYKGFLRKNAAGDLVFGIYDSNNSNWQNYITFYTSNYTRVFGSYLQAPNSDTNGSVVTTVDKSKGSGGFFKFGNGLIVQWGAVNASSSGVAVTLPTAFSSATSYRVVACREANNATMYVSAVRTSASKITVYTSNATAYGIAWIAIGY